MNDLASVVLDALDWYVSAFHHEHGAHGRDCWICNAAHEQLDQVEEALACAIRCALEPDEQLEAVA